MEIRQANESKKAYLLKVKVEIFKKSKHSDENLIGMNLEKRNMI
jgi:hypothetical protein